jgi:hypothetical protein
MVKIARGAHPKGGSPTASVVGGPARQSGAWSTWLEVVAEIKDIVMETWECFIDKYLLKNDIA